MPEFADVKGNCSDRSEINGINHCNYHKADCEDDCCPHMKEHRSKPGYIFVRCNHCHKTAEIKYHKVRRWMMKCPDCGEVIDIKYYY